MSLSRSVARSIGLFLATSESLLAGSCEYLDSHCVLIPSDTFWVDYRSTLRMLSKYNPREDWFGEPFVSTVNLYYQLISCTPLRQSDLRANRKKLSVSLLGILGSLA